MSTTDAIYSSVREHYSSAALAQYDDTNRSYSEKVASAFGYSASELQHVPDGANLGLSCGNPTALAGLKEVRCSHRGSGLIIDLVNWPMRPF